MKAIRPTGLPVWTLDEGVKFVRTVRIPFAQAGYGVGLGGSLVYRGSRTKDLDLLVFPLRSTNGVVHLDPVRSVLVAVGLTLVHDWQFVREEWRRNFGSEDQKCVEVWDYRGRRVDVFVLT